MNIKRDLIRVWIVGSVVWAVYIPLFMLGLVPNAGIADLTYRDLLRMAAFIIFPVAVAWALLYVGFWVARGFKGKQ